MRAQIDRTIVTLCAGRSRADVAADLALAFGLAGTLWLSACIFLALETVAR